jgi:hypothetical protein
VLLLVVKKSKDYGQIKGKIMNASDFIKNDSSSDGSKTYVEFQSDEDSQREAYRLCSRGGQLREGVEDIDEFFAAMIPKVAKHIFESDSIELMEWMELTEEDLEEYKEEVLEAEG